MSEIKHYSLLEEIGCGTFGIVYKGFDNTLNRVVAIKSISKKHPASPNENSSLEFSSSKIDLKEARVLAKINHPNIVTIYEVFSFKKQLHLAMEFVEGVTLSQYIQQTPLLLNEVIILIGKIVNALAYAHQHGIVHADIKPENIVVTQQGEPKLIDFGLSKLISQDSALETLVTDIPTSHIVEGTLAYMSPEIIEGNSPTAQSDIFSLGIIIYEVIMGYNPFKGQNNLATMNKILTTIPSSIVVQQANSTQVTKRISELVNHMLEKKPEKRPVSMMVIKQSLANLSITKAPLQDIAESKEAPQTEQSIKKNGNYYSRISELVNKTQVPKKLRLRTALLCITLVVILTVSLNQQIQIINDQPFTTRELINSSLTKLKSAEKKHNIASAINQLQQALKQEPDSAAANAALALAQLNKYNIEESNPKLLTQARTNAELALVLDDHLALSHSAKAWVHEYSGEDKLAQQSYQQALLFDPQNFFALEGYGRLLGYMNKYNQAIHIFKQAINFYPKIGVFYNELGKVYYHLQDFSLAKKYFKQAIEVAPDNIFGYTNLTAIYYIENNFTKAIRLLQQGLAIRQHATLYSNIGTIFFTLEKYPQAVSAFEKALNVKGNSNDYLLWSNLADAYRWSPSDKSKAKAAYQQALTILKQQFSDQIESAEIHSRKALFQAKIGIKKPALTSVERALTVVPNKTEIIFNAVVTYEVLGERENAIQQLKRLLQQNYPLTIIQAEPELTSLRKSQQYQALLLEQNQNANNINMQ